ncbi:MAG: hypothetical protein ACOC0P_02500 [Planctomycetota bacterium]
MEPSWFETPQQQSDRIAREAARLLATGDAEDVKDAVRKAIGRLGWQHRENLSLPSLKRIRDHCRAMSMQALGAEGYQASIVNVWRTAEELMTVLEPEEPMLIGRAAKGEIDAGVILRIRIYTDLPINEIADVLVEYGYPDPEIVTIDTKFGRFDRIRFMDDDSELDVHITRCPTRLRAQVSGRNLFTREPLSAVASLEELRTLIDTHEREHEGDQRISNTDDDDDFDM